MAQASSHSRVGGPWCLLPLSSCSAAGLTLSCSFSGSTLVDPSFNVPLYYLHLYMFGLKLYIFKKQLLWARKVLEDEKLNTVGFLIAVWCTYIQFSNLLWLFFSKTSSFLSGYKICIKTFEILASPPIPYSSIEFMFTCAYVYREFSRLWICCKEDWKVGFFIPF